MSEDQEIRDLLVSLGYQMNRVRLELESIRAFIGAPEVGDPAPPSLPGNPSASVPGPHFVPGRPSDGPAGLPSTKPKWRIKDDMASGGAPGHYRNIEIFED